MEMEGVEVQQDKEGSHEVIQIVLGVDSEGLKLLPVDEEDEEDTDDHGDDNTTTSHLTAVTGEDGITYIQVEGSSEMAESLLQAMANGATATEDGEGAEERTALSSDDYAAAIAEATSEDTVITGDDDSSQQQQYILQSPPNYKLELLQSIAQEASSDSFLDFPVFCQDGLAWSNRLLLTAMSTTIRAVLADLGETDSCLILPEVTRVEFATFHRALFAKEGDASLDFIPLIKVAELLGAELFLTTNFPASEEAFPVVNYKSTMDSYQERKKVFRSLGYEVEGDLGGRKSKTILAQLSAILGSDVSCDICGRTFVDEISLKKHHGLLHTEKPLASLARSNALHECDLCKKRFTYAISVKKHKWLAHTKVARFPTTAFSGGAAAVGPERVADKASAKLKRVKEKFEDMKCTVCGVEATTWKQLQIHMMDHTKERPFKCETCGKGFKEPQKLRRHRVTHTGEKNHKCKFCNKAFGLRHNMRSHERIHLGQGHFCRYCGKMFSQVTNLREHEDIHSQKGHIVSDDEEVRKSQEFMVKKRGRPSIMDLDRKKKQIEENEEEEEKEAANAEVADGNVEEEKSEIIDPVIEGRREPGKRKRTKISS